MFTINSFEKTHFIKKITLKSKKQNLDMLMLMAKGKVKSWKKIESRKTFKKCYNTMKCVRSSGRKFSSRNNFG